nr:asparagine synthase-related protein [Streptomyces sp. SID5468]
MQSASGGRSIAHPSGRPWIVGHWAEDAVVRASVGDRSAVVFGMTDFDERSLAAGLATVVSTDETGALTGPLAGSHHLCLSVGGEVRLQGSLSGVREVYFAEHHGVTVASGSAALAARLSGRGVDEERLALRLLAPDAPWPVGDESGWAGVTTLPVGHWLRLARDGGGRVVRWWVPPEPRLPMAAAAAAVREALAEAVAVRTARGGVLSADLSGGLDSAGLCFLAADGPARLVTLHALAVDAGNDDSAWAARSAERLGAARHVVVAADDGPRWFATPPCADGDLEGPVVLARTRAKAAHAVAHAAREGSRIHLTGIGGDELFTMRPALLHAMARAHPAVAVRQLRATRTLGRWSLLTTARQVWGGGDYPRWLARCAERLTLTPGSSWVTGADWGVPPVMPPWATPRATATARRLLAAAAEARPAPLAPLRVQHDMIRAVRAAGAAVRGLGHAVAGLQVAYEAPYLDDRVLDAALAVRLADRWALDHYKPVLAAALRGVVPGELLDRRTKGDYSAELFTGLRRHRDDVLDVCAELADRGLVDGQALRAALTGLHPVTRGLLPLDATLSCATWLRAVGHDTAWQGGAA